MSSIDNESVYYDDEDMSDYYEVRTVGEYTVLTTIQYGYTYILTYNHYERRYNIVGTTNPNIFPKQ
jgi:hypothetical protein